MFTVHSPEHPATEVGLFLDSPFDFEAAYRRLHRIELVPGLAMTFASLADLLALERTAGRPIDLEDVRALESLPGSEGRDG